MLPIALALVASYLSKQTQKNSALRQAQREVMANHARSLGGDTTRLDMANKRAAIGDQGFGLNDVFGAYMQSRTPKAPLVQPASAVADVDDAMQSYDQRTTPAEAREEDLELLNL